MSINQIALQSYSELKQQELTDSFKDRLLDSNHTLSEPDSHISSNVYSIRKTSSRLSINISVVSSLDQNEL